jgi:hypothetical protein
VVVVVRGRSRTAEIDTQDEKTEKAEKPAHRALPLLADGESFIALKVRV